MRAAVLVSVVAAGLAAGWLGRAAWEPSRPEAMLTLFRDHCVPFARAATPVQPRSPLRQLRIDNAREYWGDPRSRLVVEHAGRTCAVTDIIAPLSDAEAAELHTLVREAVAKDFPGLMVEDANELGWDIFVLWHNGAPPGTRDRWGVTLARVPSSQGGQTSLSLSAPAGQPA